MAFTKRNFAGACMLSLGLALMGWMDTVGDASEDWSDTIMFQTVTSPAANYQQHLTDIVAHSENNPDYTIVVMGHTNPRAPTAVSLANSQKRADRVAADLRRLGIDKSRIVSIGFGESSPPLETGGKHETTTMANRRADRVEVVLTINPEKFQP